MGFLAHPPGDGREVWRHEVGRVLAALGGEGTLGDVVTITGLTRETVIEALEALLAEGVVHVKVSESGDVTYHLGVGPPARPLLEARASLPRWHRTVGFDRKTLQLIRVREGVISLAELVEHTGLPLARAEVEMRRLAEWYGGVPHTSLDGHVVHAFPELMTSAHGRFGTREPRPAWVRREDPMRTSRAGVVATLIRRLLGPLRLPPGFLPPRRATVRRYLLGLVTQTALAGKGVVSLDRAVRYVAMRTGARRVPRRLVEHALRQLAAEFDAPVTSLEGDLFFGFRSVKRQFLASHLVRRELRLARTASGETVFDSADPPLAAAERELRTFDLALATGSGGAGADATKPMTTPT